MQNSESMCKTTHMLVHQSLTHDIRGLVFWPTGKFMLERQSSAYKAVSAKFATSHVLNCRRKETSIWRTFVISWWCICMHVALFQ